MSYHTDIQVVAQHRADMERAAREARLAKEARKGKRLGTARSALRSALGLAA